MTLTDYWRSALDPERVMQVRVTRWQGQEQQQRDDVLTVEEPFEVRIDSCSVAMIMRTPGHDFELALGFLFSEGIIQSADDVLTIQEAIDADGLPLANVVDVTLRSQGERATVNERSFAVSASCGLCGKNRLQHLSSRALKNHLSVLHHCDILACLCNILDNMRRKQYSAIAP
jgi:FdhD protein